MHKFQSMHGESDLVKAIMQTRGRSGTGIMGGRGGGGGGDKMEGKQEQHGSGGGGGKGGGSDGVDGRNAVGICMEEDGAEKEAHQGTTMTSTTRTMGYQEQGEEKWRWDVLLSWALWRSCVIPR